MQRLRLQQPVIFGVFSDHLRDLLLQRLQWLLGAIFLPCIQINLAYLMSILSVQHFSLKSCFQIHRGH